MLAHINVGQKAKDLWYQEEHLTISESCRYNPNSGELSGGAAVVQLLEYHVKEILSSFILKGVDRFICLTCGHKAGSGFALNQHYATAHTKCRTCKVQFDTEDDLCRHFGSSNVHRDKYCQACRLVFSSKALMPTRMSHIQHRKAPKLEGFLLAIHARRYQNLFRRGMNLIPIFSFSISDVFLVKRNSVRRNLSSNISDVVSSTTSVFGASRTLYLSDLSEIMIVWGRSCQSPRISTRSSKGLKTI